MAAKTLTRAEFNQVKPQGDYSKYLRYIGKRREANRNTPPPAKTSTPYDPLAPTPPPKLRAQAQSTVMAGVTPVLANIDKTYEGRSRAGANAIEHYTGSLAEHLTGLGALTDAAYGRAAAETSAIDERANQLLAGLGADQTSKLRQQLGQMGATPAALDAASTPQAVGLGAGSALFGLGEAGATRIATEGAAQRSLAGSFDKVAALGGLESTRALQAQLNQQRTEERGAITAQVPGQVADLYRTLTDNEFQKAVAVQGGLTDAAKIDAQIQSDTADRQFDETKLATDDANRDADRASREQIAAERAAAASRTAAQRANKDGKVTPSERRSGFRMAQSAGLQLAKGLLAPKTEKVKVPVTVTGDNGEVIQTGDFTTETRTLPQKPFGDVVEAVYGLIQEQLAPYGYTTLQIRKIARQIVISAGGVPAAQRG